MLLALIPLLLASSLSAQPPKGTAELEHEIRKLDRAEAAAVLVTDVPAIEKLWADDFTVNAPNKAGRSVVVDRASGDDHQSRMTNRLV
jgi:hypothetical protein